MTNITNFQDILGATNGDKTSVLGKFLYFSLANILVEKEALAQLCEDLNIPYSGSKRLPCRMRSVPRRAISRIGSR